MKSTLTPVELKRMRDQFACAALPAICEGVFGNATEPDGMAEWIATSAYEVADAMLNHRIRMPFVPDPGPPEWYYGEQS